MRPSVVVLQAIQNGDAHDLGATARGGRGADGHELTDPLMRACLVKIPEAVLPQDTLEVVLTEHDDVVEAFAANAETVHRKHSSGAP